MACAVAVPKLLKAVIAVDGIRKIAIQNTKEEMKAAEEATSKRHDILSQRGTSWQKCTSESWPAQTAPRSSSAQSSNYYMMKNPTIMAKTTAEVDDALAAGKLTWPPKYQDVVASLPYVCAVIKEASRYFPTFAVQIPRYALPEGITLNGTFIPPGFRVGMNPHIVQMDKSVFGKDADVFRPERWLESEEQNKLMDRAYLSFGVGTRPCAGKDIANRDAQLALAEIHKLVPAMLRTFTVEIAHDQPWKIHNASFIVQTDVICRLKRRN
ncbi:cytochrome P450 [Bimuria novae-zelandiae CBS 107.79]|uniref:Cytochrome P450 n=1 Tax=Bimuria novae-zelandiae CBS 107.79 TaxID=1447943 RepID=A0A6A5VST7_9PLEO|nr:cytochrome P450 [Bimuria novae-zelandiae CBS 107.79]